MVGKEYHCENMHVFQVSTINLLENARTWGSLDLCGHSLEGEAKWEAKCLKSRTASGRQPCSNSTVEENEHIYSLLRFGFRSR